MIEKDFRFSIPIELIKSKEGEWRIGGIASDQEAHDLQGEQVLIEGLDLSYLTQRGTFNWDHGKDPGDIVGEIDLAQKVDGNRRLYVEGFLYPNVKKAREIYDLMQSLKKCGSKRKLGLSLEGKIKERDETGRQIRKAWIKNVAITYHPINQGTWVDFCKSEGIEDVGFESLEIKSKLEPGLEEVEKAEKKCPKIWHVRYKKENGEAESIDIEAESKEDAKKKLEEKGIKNEDIVLMHEKEIEKAIDPRADESGNDVPVDDKEKVVMDFSKWGRCSACGYEGGFIEDSCPKCGAILKKGEVSEDGGLKAGYDVPATSGGVSGSALRKESLDRKLKVTTYDEKEREALKEKKKNKKKRLIKLTKADISEFLQKKKEWSPRLADKMAELLLLTLEKAEKEKK